MFRMRRLAVVLVVSSALLLVATIGCGGSPQQVSGNSGAAPSAEPPSAVPSNSNSNSGKAPAPPAEQVADELAEKEKDLDRREAEVALAERERELVKREAALNAKPAAAKPPAAAKGAGSAALPAPAPAPPAKAAPVVVPAGTQLSVEFVSALTTKTAKVGDRVDARLASDLVVDGTRVAPAGALVQGAVTQVVSGSKKIGGTPTLGVTFDGLELAAGSMVAISGQLVQQGKSDTAKDSAKIAGAVAAGAIIGHQVSDDKGKIIGGLLGGAAGTAAAAKTGGEVEVPAGTIVGFALDAPLQVE